MNKIITFAAFAATALFATPALADSDFSGVRGGVVGGVADDNVFGTDTVTYGANVGYDFDLGNVVVGVTGEYQNSKDSGRELSAVARLGTKVGDKVLVYALGGYTNLAVGTNTGVKLDGYRVGGGVEVNMGSNTFVNVEQRYSNYGHGVDGWQTAVGVGLRF